MDKYIRMSYSIEGLLDKLKRFNHDLNENEIFVQQIWERTGEVNKSVRFQEEGVLVINVGKDLLSGYWKVKDKEEIAFLISGEERIYRKIFLDRALFILKEKSMSSEQMVLINRGQTGEPDALGYLKVLYYQMKGIALAKLLSGQTLEIHGYRGWIEGNTVTCDGDPVPDGPIFIPKNKKKYLIQNSQIRKVIVRVAFHYKDGALAIEKEENKDPAKGDEVFYNSKPAKNGCYKIWRFSFIKVRNGRITLAFGLRFLRQ